MFENNENQLHPELPEEIPMSILNNQHALKVHGQSLQQLHDNGGMSPVEIVGNILKMPIERIFDYPPDQAIKDLKEILKNEQDKQQD